MMLLSKATLGIGGTIVLAGAYSFHEGVIRVDVDEYRSGGSHVHLWVPAAVVPMSVRFVPTEHLREASEQARDFLPAAHALVKQLKKFPDAELVEVLDGEQRVRIRTYQGKLQIDVKDPHETVHLLCPLATLDDLADQLQSSGPGS